VVEFKHILCPIDLEASSEHPLAYAAAIAAWYQSTLTVEHIVPTFDAVPIMSGDFMTPAQVIPPLSREDVLAAMRRMVEPITGSASVSYRADEGDPSAVIIERALELPADLLVLGTQARRGIQRLLLGSVTESVMHDAPCPVLAVPPRAPRAASPLQLKHILCPIDFSPSAMQALGFALDLARQAHGAVTLLSAVEWLSEDTREYAHFNVPEYRRHLLADAESRLQALVADESRTWVEVDTVVTSGRAYYEILKVATDRNIELIVMGAQGRSGVGQALFGSTTEQVLRRAACPVLTVRGMPDQP
jgi:nucleotide-binding universal stress UspA family protein